MYQVVCGMQKKLQVAALTPHPAALPLHPAAHQVAQLETQLAAAERCAAELRELSAQLGSVRQEDVEVLKVGSSLLCWSRFPCSGQPAASPCSREPAAEAGDRFRVAVWVDTGVGGREVLQQTHPSK